MANHCDNYLQAPDGDVSLLTDYVSHRNGVYLPDVYLDFEKILPYPKPIKDSLHLWDEGASKKDRDKAKKINQAMTGYDSWYEWGAENWGTAQNSFDGCVNEDSISFMTAWTPPIQAIVELSKQIGRPLRMLYDESGMDFCGELLAQPDGTFVDNVYSPRSKAPKEIRDSFFIDEEAELDKAYENRNK